MIAHQSPSWPGFCETAWFEQFEEYREAETVKQFKTVPLLLLNRRLTAGRVPLSEHWPNNLVSAAMTRSSWCKLTSIWLYRRWTGWGQAKILAGLNWFLCCRCIASTDCMSNQQTKRTRKHASWNQKRRLYLLIETKSRKNSDELSSKAGNEKEPNTVVSRGKLSSSWNRIYTRRFERENQHSRHDLKETTVFLWLKNIQDTWRHNSLFRIKFICRLN